MTLASFDATPGHTHTSAREAVRPRHGRRSTALPAFTELGDRDLLARHYALAYWSARRGGATTQPTRECA
jgi:hypothetical protein